MFVEMNLFYSLDKNLQFKLMTWYPLQFILLKKKNHNCEITSLYFNEMKKIMFQTIIDPKVYIKN